MNGSSSWRDPSARRTQIRGVDFRARKTPSASGESGVFIKDSHVGKSLMVDGFPVAVPFCNSDCVVFKFLQCIIVGNQQR